MADETAKGDVAPAEVPTHDQAFFLDLALKSKDNKEIWNEWRRAHEGVPVTFAGIDFSKTPNDEINFEGFKFGDHADFSQCCGWGMGSEDQANFGGAVFGDEADFTGATFGYLANFARATFGHSVNFAGAVFGDAAKFTGAAFGHSAEFAGAAFGHSAEFAGATFFSEANFAGADFGSGANFTGAAFGDRASFAGATFGLKVSLTSMSFEANFAGATFSHLANFTGAIFGEWANFTGATFRDKANFAGATFRQADFPGAAFGCWASFDGATFGNWASFNGAAFGPSASFVNTFFKGRVEFTGKSEEQWAMDVLSPLGMNEKARAALEKRHKDSWETNGSRLDRFLTISFSHARFDGVAAFSGRSFEKTAIFTNARFYTPPDFEWCGGTARIDFTGAHIGFIPPGKLHWTSNTGVPVRLRALRKIAEETKNHDLAHDLYIEERRAERGVYWCQLVGELKNAPEELKNNLEDIKKQKKHVWLEWRLQRRARNAYRLGIAVKIVRLFTHLLWIAVMGVYWALADYGRSFVRPAAWLIASGFFFYWRYLAVLADKMAKARDIEGYKQAVRMLALGNTVPFVGPLTVEGEVKKFLFCPSGADNCVPIPPEGYQLLVLSQNLLSIILVFFIGLALRNYFRIK